MYVCCVCCKNTLILILISAWFMQRYLENIVTPHLRLLSSSDQEGQDVHDPTPMWQLVSNKIIIDHLFPIDPQRHSPKYQVTISAKNSIVLGL